MGKKNGKAKVKTNGAAEVAAPPPESPEPQVSERVLKTGVPLGTGPVKVASGKTAKVEVRVSFLGGEDERFIGTRILNTGESDGLYIQYFGIGDKSQVPCTPSAPVNVGAFDSRLDNALRLDPAKRGDSFLIEVQNTSKGEREFSMTIFGRVSKMVPVAPVARPDKRAGKGAPGTVLADAIERLSRGERLVDPEAVYKLFVIHASRFLHDLTGAMVEAAEEAFPPPASPIFSALRDAVRARGEN